MIFMVGSLCADNIKDRSVKEQLDMNGVPFLIFFVCRCGQAESFYMLRNITVNNKGIYNDFIFEFYLQIKYVVTK